MKGFLKSSAGNSAISFAIVLPVLLLIILAVIEFGLYFIKDQTALNGIGAVSNILESNPADDKAQEFAATYGGNFLGFDKDPNYFCAKAYETWPEANLGSCVAGWNTSRPAGMDVNETYFIAIAARTEKFKVAISDFLPDIHQTAVVQFGMKAPEVALEFFESDLACNVHQWRYIVGATTEDTFCSLSGVDIDTPKPVSGYHCQLTRLNGTWAYKFPVGCGDVNCIASCVKFSIKE